jgi:ribosomal protein S27E
MAQEQANTATEQGMQMTKDSRISVRDRACKACGGVWRSLFIPSICPYCRNHGTQYSWQELPRGTKTMCPDCGHRLVMSSDGKQMTCFSCQTEYSL